MTSATAAAGGPQGRAAAAWGRLQSAGLLGPIGALVLELIVFSALSPRFATGANFSLIAQQVVEVGTLAIGQTLIILTAGIDLANGLVMVFGSVIMAKLAVSGTPVWLAVLIGIAVTTGFGLVEGIAVAGFRLSPFVVTLGLFNVALAAALLYTNQASVINLPAGLLVLGGTVPIGGAAIPVGPLVMLGVTIVVWYALTQTAWGRRVYALGDNPAAARLSGVHTKRVLASVYIVAGVIYGITAWLVLGRTTVGDPNAGFTDNLESITAVVIGGVSLFGGRGSVIGAFIGAFIVGVLRNGLTIVGIDALYQDIAIGLLVIVAVGIDRLQRRRAR